MYIGDGAKIVRDAFALAKEKAPTIIFIDELDAIGTKRFDSEKTGDREVQRTMLELLNQVKYLLKKAGRFFIRLKNKGYRCNEQTGHTGSCSLEIRET